MKRRDVLAWAARLPIIGVLIPVAASARPISPPMPPFPEKSVVLGGDVSRHIWDSPVISKIEGA